MAFKKIRTDDRELREVQDNVEVALRETAIRPLSTAVLVADVPLTTSNAEVRHGTGGPINGWLVVKQNASASIYSATAHSNPREFIYLKASAAVTVTLLFF